MMPIKACEWDRRKKKLPSFNRRTIFFIQPIWERVPPELRRYLAWPMRATDNGVLTGERSYFERAFGKKYPELWEENDAKGWSSDLVRAWDGVV